VLARPQIRSPKALEGRRAGVTGLPSDDAVLRSVVRGAGGRPGRVRTTTIGFAAVKSLLAGRVDAATGFWNVEGVALKARRPGFREFRVDDYGAPRYPELVLCVSRETLQDEPDTVRAAIRALQRGYGVVRRDPESAASAMLERERSLDRENLMRQLDAVAPAYQAGVPAYGQLVAERLREWAEWDVEFGILRRAPDLDEAFDPSFVGRVDNP
jgi:ABC-type nitrate/sulfonate/bicarbonate transport system substrate-binding protein